jgi:hypothetical protein
MKRLRFLQVVSVGFMIIIMLVTSLLPHQIVQAAGVVGTGTPGSCTEAAFDAALTGGGTISFNCGAAPHTIILSSIKVISTDTEIQGSNLITLSGGNATPLFTVNATLTLRDILLTRGFGSYGTIQNLGTLNLIGSQITHGHSNSHGGAIMNYGEVKILSSTLAHNEAANTAGALFNDWGNVTIENSEIYSNTGQNDSGAIYNNIGTMSIHNSHIYDNKSLDCSATSRGGGLFNNGILTINQSTISNNRASNGAGIYNVGTITLENVTIEGNLTYYGCYGDGGGMINDAQASVVNSGFIDNYGAAYGGGLYTGSNSQMTITDSTFTQNQATAGGAITNSGTLTLTNSTVYTNTSDYGGGIANGISGGTPNILFLTNVTVSDNSSLSGAGGLQTDNGTTTVNFATFADNQGGSGIERLGGQLIFKNSIVTGSSPKNCEGTVTSQGFNISSDYSCTFNHGGDKTNTDPMLEPLGDNGGSTLTHLPDADSPAVDGGQCVAGISTDQRGVSRPQEAACDIGAVEFSASDAGWWIYLPLLTR